MSPMGALWWWLGPDYREVAPGWAEWEVLRYLGRVLRRDPGALLSSSCCPPILLASTRACLCLCMSP